LKRDFQKREAGGKKLNILFTRLYVAGKKPKFYAVSLLDRKEVAISLGKLEKGSVLLKRTARVQVRNTTVVLSFLLFF
jgi:hypothetical protein